MTKYNFYTDSFIKPAHLLHLGPPPGPAPAPKASTSNWSTGNLEDDLKKAGVETLRAFAGILSTTAGAITGSISFIRDIIHKDPDHLPQVNLPNFDGKFTSDVEIRVDKIRYYNDLIREYSKMMTENNKYFVPFNKTFENLKQENVNRLAGIKRYDALIINIREQKAKIENESRDTLGKIRAFETVQSKNEALLTRTVLVKELAKKKFADAKAKTPQDINGMNQAIREFNAAKKGIGDLTVSIRDTEVELIRLRSNVKSSSSGDTLADVEIALSDAKKKRQDFVEAKRSFGDADMTPLINLLVTNSKLDLSTADFLKKQSYPLEDFIAVFSGFSGELGENKEKIQSQMDACNYKIQSL